MAYEDIRQFCEALRREEDIVNIKEEVDWDLEAGAIARRSCEMRGPAVLFGKIKDYPEGYRILSGSLAAFKRVAMAMGLHPETPVRDIYAEYEAREQKPVKPVIVPTGPCKENIITGDDIDIFRFPAPMIHDGDGGRFLATWDVVVCKDPDSDWTNWGMYRFMTYNEKSMVGTPQVNSHLAIIHAQKYIPRRLPMPVAIVIGADPISSLVATAPYAPGVSEVDYAGALRQKPVELTRCETSDLLVPASAEIVIEGEILPDMYGPEGPFGEYPGYRTARVYPGLVLKIKAITHRNSPIVSMISLGTPIDGSSAAASLSASLAMKRRLKRHGIPVTQVYCPPEGATHTAIISVSQGGSDIVHRIMDVFAARRVAVSKIIVIDDDIDAFNLGDVIHVFSTKCHPLRGVIQAELPSPKANPLTPAYNNEEKRLQKGGLVAFDATWPPEWPEADVPIRCSFNAIYPKELQDKVVSKWQKYGFKG